MKILLVNPADTPYSLTTYTDCILGGTELCVCNLSFEIAKNQEMNLLICTNCKNEDRFTLDVKKPLTADFLSQFNIIVVLSNPDAII